MTSSGSACLNDGIVDWLASIAFVSVAAVQFVHFCSWGVAAEDSTDVQVNGVLRWIVGSTSSGRLMFCGSASAGSPFRCFTAAAHFKKSAEHSQRCRSAANPSFVQPAAFTLVPPGRGRMNAQIVQQGQLARQRVGARMLLHQVIEGTLPESCGAGAPTRPGRPAVNAPSQPRSARRQGHVAAGRPGVRELFPVHPGWAGVRRGGPATHSGWVESFA